MSTGFADIAAPPVAAVAAPPRARMAIALLALIGVVIAAYMLLYRLGIIAQVACGAGACATVQASPWSVFLGVPVPLWGVGGYGLIFGLALLGIQPDRADDRRIGAGLIGLGTFAFGFSLYLSWVEAVLLQAWCRWCVASAIVATLLFVLSLAEIPRLRRAAG